MSNPIRLAGAKLFTLCSGLVFLAVLLGFTTGAAKDSRAADEAAIRKADADWVKAAQTKQVDAWMAFYSDGAVILPPNEKLAGDKESQRKLLSGFLGMPGLTISWQPTKVEVARSGDVGYLYGTYEMSWTEEGKRATDTGKMVEIWKKQPKGDWKCVVDTWNSDVPPAPLNK